jgi:hypothetical protein
MKDSSSQLQTFHTRTKLPLARLPTAGILLSILSNGLQVLNNKTTCKIMLGLDKLKSPSEDDKCDETHREVTFHVNDDHLHEYNVLRLHQRNVSSSSMIQFMTQTVFSEQMSAGKYKW